MDDIPAGLPATAYPIEVDFLEIDDPPDTPPVRTLRIDGPGLIRWPTFGREMQIRIREAR